MELLQLRYFLVAARYEHMTHAAEQLHIAQPALTQSIQRLESELGMPLFDRKSRGISLNDSGRLLQKKLYPILAALDSLPEELREANDFSSHTIHLNMLAASTMVTKCIIAYKAQYPNDNFQLYQNRNSDNYDLCVSMVAPGSVQDERTQTILEEEFFLAVPAASPYAGRSSIRLGETSKEGYISLDKTRPIRAICDQFCETAGFTPHIVFESDNPENVRNLISAGIGIGFWPKYSWGPLRSSQVVLLPIESPECRRDIIVTKDKEGWQNPVVRNFYRYLLSYAKQM